MRASDLIGLPVLDSAHQRLGVVVDLRCVQDGPLRGATQAPRIAALIVSRRHTGSLLGYDRRHKQGPWLIRRIVQYLHRDAILIPWENITAHHDQITLTPDATGIEKLPQ